MSDAPVIVWFRQDLRIVDNPALFHAAETDKPVIPLYIHSPDEEGNWSPGAASSWWLHHSLSQLGNSLSDLGSDLVVRSGDALSVLTDLIEKTGAVGVNWNRRYEPMVIARDKEVKKALKKKGVDVSSFKGSLLFEPHEIETQAGGPYKVFSPFWKRSKEHLSREVPLPAPTALRPFSSDVDTEKIESLELLPTIDWDSGFYEAWDVGENSAMERFGKFIDDAIVDYSKDRNKPGIDGTARLSPHLHFGEISPRQIHHRLLELDEDNLFKRGTGIEAFFREIGWREFAYHLIYHFPETTDTPLYSKFESFPWVKDKNLLERWQKGLTGYPLVDAGMRQLWHTGWMHNRVRMLVASFLVKDLLIHWLEGAKWFWDTLVDADLASNSMGWQWAAGSGADAAPYFRVFNPISQSKKFDSDGDYIRRWIPELAGLSAKQIHEPWLLDEDVLKKASSNDDVYPQPIVEHSEARHRALMAYEKIK
ncbi:MAG: deoxyribodipyrimidine photo-lyase [Rhodothermales bacterium]|nr:deoxyribodipyrimidine photo-lyase [Rhodothermales bacterium]